jgi:hypothetical protein
MSARACASARFSSQLKSAVAAEHDRAQLGVGAQLQEGRGQLADHGGIEGVAHFGAVEIDPGHVARAGDVERSGHAMASIRS